MFRYSIDTEKYKQLRQEVDHVQAYIQIIQVRYPERIRCHYEIPEHLDDQPVLKLILQPLVENAIEHGLIPKGTYGNIRITAEADRNELILRVEDDGVGMTFNRLQEIKKTLGGLGEEHLDDEKLLAGHVGLVNVSQRLYLNYGELGRLSIESNHQAGTVVEIRLPMDKEREERSDV
jgi:two-component system sensor histidine kinase YesM